MAVCLLSRMVMKSRKCSIRVVVVLVSGVKDMIVSRCCCVNFRVLEENKLPVYDMRLSCSVVFSIERMPDEPVQVSKYLVIMPVSGEKTYEQEMMLHQ